MATSVFFTSDNKSLQTQLPENHHDQYHHPLQPIRRGSSGRRKPGKTAGGEQKKKQPQRGMGVEKLERLRIAEKFKNPVSADLSLVNASFHQYSKLGGFEAPNAGLGQMGPDPFHIGPFGVGGSPDTMSFRSKSTVTHEISTTELSSNPNDFKSFSGYSTPKTCNKKKRFNGGNIGFGSSTSTVKGDIMNMQCGSLGLNVGSDNYYGQNNMLINQENQNQGKPAGFKTTSVYQFGYATRPGQPGTELLAVHKKGSSSENEGNYNNNYNYNNNNNNNNNLVVEYEFFPGCKKKEDCNPNNDELVMMKQNTCCLGIGAPAAAGFDAQASSSSIDLSLKLSY